MQRVLLLLGAVSVALADDWRAGRASYYGTDGWSIHKGSCGFGYCWPDIGTGWDVAAIADASPEFAGSCGRCYEVRCASRMVVDGYGNQMDRTSGICRDSSTSVVVRTVDNCPCNYPANAYSNKRWCCGDNKGTQGTHFDLSIWAFEKLAETKWGVIPLEFRPVSCDYKPSKPAPELAYPTQGEAPPSDAKKPTDYTYVKRTDWTGQSQGAVKQVADPSQAYGGAQVAYSSLFSGGGAFTIDPTGVSNQYSATNRLGGSPFGAASASATASSSSVFSSSSSYASSSGGAAYASASASSGPMVIAFNGPSDSSSDGSSNDGCSDTPPPNSGASCQQQKNWGKCGDSFMQGYCLASCGKCTIASPSPAPSSSSSGGCTDVPPPNSGVNCQQQKAWGKCSDGFVQGYCLASCGKCAASASPSPSPSPPPSPASSSSSNSGCSDVPPPNSGASCQQQKAWGKCSDSFMQGFCLASCGKCTSSPSAPAQSTSPSSSSTPQVPASSSSTASAQDGAVYYKGFQNGFSSWSFSSSFSERAKLGVNGDQAVCGTINQYGGFQAGNAASGKAAGKNAVQFWTDAPLDALTINLGSQSATCTAKPLKSVGASEQQSGFSKFYIPFSSLGCGFGIDQLTRITLANTRQSSFYMCVSDVRFV
ncbi:hypothetical protein N2152v2_001203 [Parachlorella kessleri]